MDARTGYAKTPDGAHLAYSVSGAGDVDILNLSPYMISIDSYEDEPRVAHYYRRLSAFARVIRFDKRGVGLSDPVDPKAAATPASMAADASVVLGSAGGGGPVVVLAEAGAGPIALELAVSGIDGLASLVLVNTYAALVADPPDYDTRVTREMLERFLADNPDPEAHWDLEGDDDLDLMAWSLRGDASLREWWWRASRRAASPVTARLLVGSVTLADARPLLAHVDVPTLVIHSRRNRFVPFAAGRYLADHIAGAKFVALDSADSAAWAGDADVIVDEIEEFVTGRRSGAVERVLATVLFTDIVDSTGRAAALGDRAWTALLDRHDAIVRAELARYGGREVKSTGDGFLGVFDSPTQAVRCAHAIVTATAGSGIAVRAGIHTGESERRGDDYAGLTVHIAARVAGLAASGEVLVSRTVRDLVAGSELRFADQGTHELKGVPETWQLFALVD